MIIWCLLRVVGISLIVLIFLLNVSVDLVVEVIGKCIGCLY